MAKTDIRLKEDIEEELRWDPKVNAAQIAVSVDNGAVSLLGAVDIGGRYSVFLARRGDIGHPRPAARVPRQ